jgi:hypothetical protein
MINYEIKEINHLIKDKNHLDNKIYNSNLINSYNKNSAHILKSKIINDNSKLNGNNNKNTFINKRNRQNSEKIIHNYNEHNIKKLNNNTISKKLGLISIPIKQNKLILVEQNKNISLLNSQGFSKSNEKRKNKFLFPDNKENQFGKTINILINNKDNKDNNSLENKYKQIFNNNKSINNSNQKKNLEINTKNESANIINKEIIHPINNNEKNSNKDNEIKKNNLSNNSNSINNDNNKTYNSIADKFNNNNKLNSLSVKEKACYILSQSNVLRLCERIIFSRTNEKISKLISIKDILKSNELFIKNKIKELEENINNYNRIIDTPFSPSKTAIISLNLIMKEDEDDFKNFSDNNYIDEEDENNYYYIFIELFFILLDEKNYENNDINMLYDKLYKKGFLNLKDYLYQFFVLQKFKKELLNENKIDKFNEIFEQLPNLIKYDVEIKNSKFISFSYFILYEANNYWKNYKEYKQLKQKIQYYIDSLKKKISNYK